MRLTLLSMTLMILFASVGCSDHGYIELGTVTGVVTLDGKPLDGAEVTFEPAGGRSSSGFTDETGRYELEYTMEKKGAVLGPHVVRIASARGASGGEGGQPAVEARKELLPAKYRDKSELTAEVNKGANTIDFALQSK